MTPSPGERPRGAGRGALVVTMLLALALALQIILILHERGPAPAETTSSPAAGQSSPSNPELGGPPFSEEERDRIQSSIARNRDSFARGRMGLLAQDIRQAREAIQRDPKNPMPRHKLAILQFDSGDIEGSVQTYREILRINPKDSLGHADLARMLVHAGRLDEAAAEVVEASRCIRELEGLERILALKPGMVVADIGCGSGRYTVALARWVGAKGKVYAVDVETEALTLVSAVKKREGLAQVETVQCDPYDARLPEASLDAAYLCEVYVHVANLEDNAASADPWMLSICKALRPGGRIFITGEPPPTSEMAVRQMDRLGFRLERTDRFLAEGNVLVFVRDTSKKISSSPAAGGS